MTFNVDTSPEALAKIIRDGIGSNLEALIKNELLELVDPMISKLARDLAKQTTLNVQSYYSAARPGSFEPEVRVLLSFNNEQVTYENSRTDSRRFEGRSPHEKD